MAEMTDREFLLNCSGWVSRNLRLSDEDVVRLDKIEGQRHQRGQALWLKRFVSYEPALGPVEFERIEIDQMLTVTVPGVINCLSTDCEYRFFQTDTNLDWIIAGGESGPGARPADPAWFRSVRDQCAEASVPFFFKQWGDWLPSMCDGARIEGQEQEINSSDAPIRVGKKKAGALIDGREHREFPAPGKEETQA